MSKLMFVILLLSFGCNENGKNLKKINFQYSDSNKINQKKTNNLSTSKQEKDYYKNSPTYILVLDKDSLKQKMTVQYYGREKIHFTLICSNILKNDADSISGVATMDKDQASDPETDQTDDGKGFLYDNWHFIKGNCQLAMRIADSSQFIRIFEFNCKGLHKTSCPFEAGGVLERIN